jgi:hypothetical protein
MQGCTERKGLGLVIGVARHGRDLVGEVDELVMEQHHRRNPAFSNSPHTQSKWPSTSGWRRISVWKVKRMPSMPVCLFQPTTCSRAPGASGSKRPMMAKRPGCAAAAFRATSSRSPSHDGGTGITRSMFALSISNKSSSLLSETRCDLARAGRGCSGVLAAQV